MPELQKAILQEVRADQNETPEGDPVAVQFNPTSLRLKLTNQVEGGRSRGRQRRQYNGSGSTVLSMDLIFDSADEGTVGNPVSVRTKTAIVEKYVVPKTDGSETPPRLRFEWNQLVITGIVEGLDIDFDLFAADGTPLRAKMSLTIKEQDAKYQFLEAGPGVRNGDDSQSPGGDQTAGNSDRSAAALEGESAPEFAARMGLDPAAWRGLDIDLSAGLSLEAGLDIGFSASLGGSAGVGVSAGMQAGIDLSVKAAVGLEAGAVVAGRGSLVADTKSAAGFALAAAGGVDAAIETVKVARSQQAVAQTSQAFTPTSSVSAAAGSTSATAAQNSQAVAQSITNPVQSRTPLSVSGSRSYSVQQQAATAPPPPKADPRASSFGFGAPLRPLYAAAMENGRVRVCAYGAAASSTGDVPHIRNNPTTAPWVELPRRDRGRQVADKAQQQKRRSPCAALHGACCDGDKP
ncbi:MAG: hypothetical protein GXP10_08120 [Gammaproteobacteria bacterium]|nr:hypothetical protein [Gammaproteobacteria bacterium]